MDDITAAYLAGYLERGGAIRMYINRVKDSDYLKIETVIGDTLPIESAGIYVRVRATDMTVPRDLKRMFKGKLSEGQWQGWNEDAAALLQVILPHLRTGKRKAMVNLVLEFHAFIESRKEQMMGSLLFFTVEDMEVIARYEATLREITGSK